MLCFHCQNPFFSWPYRNIRKIWIALQGRKYIRAFVEKRIVSRFCRTMLYTMSKVVGFKMSCMPKLFCGRKTTGVLKEHFSVFLSTLEIAFPKFVARQSSWTFSSWATLVINQPIVPKPPKSLPLKTTPTKLPARSLKCLVRLELRKQESTSKT